MSRFVATAVFIFAFELASFAQGSSDAALPDPAQLWQRVRANLGVQYDVTQRLKGYTYRRSSVTEDFASDGAVRKKERLEYDVYHFDAGTFQKLISKDGMPLSEKQSKKEDERLQKFRARNPRTRSTADQEKVLNDIISAFDFQVVKREIRNDRPTIVINFKPRPNAKVQTRAARLVFSKVEGTAWVDEEDAQLARIEIHFTKDVKVGFGLLVNINKDTEVTRQWSKLNNEVWVPLHNESRVKARVLLAKAYNQRQIDDYSDYKKFSVDTTIRVIGEPSE